MPCVNDHSEFLAMAAQWAENQIDVLLSAEGIAVNPHLANHHHHHHH